MRVKRDWAIYMKEYHRARSLRDPGYIEKLRNRGKHRARRIRKAVIKLLGSKCSNPNCRYMNEDGTFGCKDARILQIDHPNGGGRKEKQSVGGVPGIHRKVLKVNGIGYRLLCANCNWLHRFEDF